MYDVISYPDFLGNSRRQVYESNRALGKLYREIQPKPYRPHYYRRVDSKLVIDGHENFLKEATEVRKQYSYDLYRLMNQYGIRSEFELITQFLILDKRRQDSKREFELCQTLDQIVRKLAIKYSKVCHQRFSGFSAEL
jgi:RNA-dependent RNA polymerase